MNTIKTKDGYSVMVGTGDALVPPGQTGQKANTSCVWVNLGGWQWVRSPFRSLGQTEFAITRSTFAAVWLHFHFKTNDLIGLLRLLGLRSELQRMDY